MKLFTYYSTGKSPYLNDRGKPVVTDEITATVLLENGSVVATLAEINGIARPTAHPDIIEVKQDVVVTINNVNDVPTIPDAPNTPVKRGKPKKKAVVKRKK